MDTNIENEIKHERRIRLLDKSDPDIAELWSKTRERVERIARPGINIDEETEALLLQSLLFSYRDQLSGLPNRKALFIDLDAAVAVAKRLNISFVVLYMDGRGFKEINDFLGHLVGDNVIAAIGKAARRSTDIKFYEKVNKEKNDDPHVQIHRQGGDEFAAVLFGTDLAGAKIVEERLLQFIEQDVNTDVPEFEQKFGRKFEITIGKAQFNPEIDQNGEDVLKRADQDLTAIRNRHGQPRR